MRKPEYYTKKLFFGLLKLIFRKSGKDNLQPTFIEKRNILLIRLNNIGDALVTTPFIGQLKNKIDCNIDILCHKRNSVVFENNKSADNVFVLEKGFINFFRMLFRIRKNKYYCIVDTHNDVSATVNLFLILAKSDFRFGVKKQDSNLYTHTIDIQEPLKYHYCERPLFLLNLFGVKPDFENAGPVYNFRRESEDFVKEFKTNNFKDSKFLIGINLFAGSLARFWGTENFKKLILFLKSYPVDIILITPGKVPVNIDELSDKAKILKTDFDKLAALISKLDLLITPDTSAVHLASAYGTPVFGLYVHNNPDDIIWSPYRTDFEYAATTEETLASIKYEDAEGKLKGFLEKRISISRRDAETQRK
jgi:ADP-heptose:LPS heptosyltransferase